VSIPRTGRVKASKTTSIAPPERRPSTNADPVSAYAWDVLKGKIVANQLVRSACQRHFNDIAQASKKGLVWDPEEALIAIQFADFCRHSKGEWAGQRIKLEPWQQFIHGSVFGWLRKDGQRRFRVVYEEIARKNGKSSVAAIVALKCLVADNEPGSDVYSAATKKDQARIVFDEARKMVLRSEDLQRLVSIYRASLAVDTTFSSFQPLSSDERTLDGLNPHAVIIDELHKHKNRAVFDVLDTAMGSRRQPLLWIITTAGDDNPESVYAQERAYAENVINASFVDDEWFVYIATLDPEDRWDNPACWIKANPNLGVSVKLDDLTRQCRAAKNNPAKQIEFKRLRMNVRTASSTQLISGPLWDANSEGPFDPAELVGRRCFGGLDLSSKIDLSAWVKLFPPAEPGQRWRVVPRFWMPADTVEAKSDRDQVQYRRWIDAGLIEPTLGNIIDHNEVEAAILEDARIYDMATIAYDPWNATQLAVSLQNNGLQMTEFVQGLRSFTAPTKELLAWLLSNKIDHGGNPVLRWMALNMRVQMDKNENQMPTKRLSIGRIDGAVALIMSIGRSMADDSAGMEGFLSRPIAG
jgi:phage terminase large subunit-like protein